MTPHNGYYIRKTQFTLTYTNGTSWISEPCYWLDEAICASPTRARPKTAEFSDCGHTTYCTQAGITRAWNVVAATPELVS